MIHAPRVTGEVVVPYLSGDNVVESAKAFGAVTVVGVVAGIFTTSTLLLVIFIGLFTGPYIYQEKRDVLQPLVQQGLKIATEQHGKNVDIVPKLRDTNAFNDQSATFRDNCLGRLQPHASGRCGLVVQSILDAIYLSSEQDREVEINV